MFAYNSLWLKRCICWSPKTNQFKNENISASEKNVNLKSEYLFCNSFIVLTYNLAEDTKSIRFPRFGLLNFYFLNGYLPKIRHLCSFY